MKFMEIITKDQETWLYFNRPQAKNALNLEMIKEIVFCLNEFERNPQSKVLIITGRGDGFCAGGDIFDMKNKTGMFAGGSMELAHLYREGIQQIPLAFEKVSKPVIALVNGAAVGAGCDIACMCDMRIATDQAFFAETFSKLGLVPGDGGAYFLQRVVGYKNAMEMILTARKYSAQKALEMGLVNHVEPSEEVLEYMTSLTQNIKSLSLDALRMSKLLMKQAYQSDLSSHLDYSAFMQGLAQRSTDHNNFLSSIPT